MSKQMVAVGVVVASVASASSAFAEPAVSVQARMFRRDTGNLDEDLLKGASNTSKPVRVGNLDYGVRGREMMIDVVVPEGLGSDQLTVTIKQGKLNVSQDWRVTVGRTFGFAVAHHPMLITPTVCGGAMTITAKIGATTETRAINFACAE
jgi:hypothetical protein